MSDAYAKIDVWEIVRLCNQALENIKIARNQLWNKEIENYIEKNSKPKFFGWIRPKTISREEACAALTNDQCLCGFSTYVIVQTNYAVLEERIVALNILAAASSEAWILVDSELFNHLSNWQKV